MRNMKRMISIILTLVMLASMMVPALASGYDSQAAVLKSLGLLLGDASGNLLLDNKLNRLEGMVLTIRALGKEAEVLAMTPAEINEQLANAKDLSSFAWGTNYAAYALKQGITKGISETELVFAPQGSLSGQQFITMILRAMGYSGDTLYADAPAKAAEIGMLGLNESISFSLQNSLSRDFAAAILFGSLTTKTTSGKTLIEVLVAAGAVSESAAQAAGLIAVATPTPIVNQKPVVEAVDADNIKEVVITFSVPMDESTVEDIDNYEIDNDELTDDVITLDEDGMVAYLVLSDDWGFDNEDSFELALSGMKSESGVAMDDDSFDIELVDDTTPKVSSVKAIGSMKIDITFSEWVTETTASDSDNYLIDDDTVTDDVTWYGKTASITLSDPLEEGTHTLRATKYIEDFADFPLTPRDVEFEVEEENDEPEVDLVSATQTEVIVEFSEQIMDYGDILIDDDDLMDDFDGTAVLADDRRTMTITVPRDEALDVDGVEFTFEDVADYSNNSDTLTLDVEPEEDDARPAYVSYSMNDENGIVLVFSEGIWFDSYDDTTGEIDADVSDYFTLLDEDDDVVDLTALAYKLDDDDEILYEELVLETEASAGTYTLQMSELEDMSPLENKIRAKTITIEVDDNVAPKVVGKYVDDANDALFITFDEKLDEGAAESKSNWTMMYDSTSKSLSKDSDVTVTLMTDDSTVRIQYDMEDEEFIDDLSDIEYIQFEDIADMEGNVADGSLKLTTFVSAGIPEVTKAAVVGKNAIEITISETLIESTISTGDFIVYADENEDGDFDSGEVRLSIADIDYDDDDDLITLTMSRSLSTDGTYDGDPLILFTRDEPYAETALGVSLEAVPVETNADGIRIVDNYAPTISDIDYVFASGKVTVTITVSEAIHDTGSDSINSDNEFAVLVDGVNMTSECDFKAIDAANPDELVLEVAASDGDEIDIMFNPKTSCDLKDANEINYLKSFHEVFTVED